MANLLDRAIAYLSPGAALKREHARRVLAYYEAARADRLRKNRRETGSGNAAVARAGGSLRQQARHLEQNYDIALGVLNVLVANTVGPNGIGIEPQPRRLDGSIHDQFAAQLLALYKDWCRRPEVTWCHDWPAAQRLLARTWFRDGEAFVQSVEGLGPYIDHGTRVPLSLELMEPDLVPLDLSANATGNARIEQGVEINAWGRPVAYHVLKAFPGEASGGYSSGSGTKRISADTMLHVATRHRIRQLRGVSIFASVLNRFDDLKDYEESERVAAKVAASMAAFIKKGTPDLYEGPADGEQRHLKFRPGMIFDDLRPGEEIGTIDTNRPNPNLETYRSGQIKAIAAGTGPTYSSVSKTYDGTYSAQRQELVEGWIAYATLSAEFASRIVRPVWEKFVALAILSGNLRLPADLDRTTLDDAIYINPQMPWIDPKKEAEAWGMLEDRAYASGPEIIRKRGGNPIDVLDQQARWRREKEARDIPVDAAAASPPPDPAPPAEPNGDNAMAASLAALVAGVHAAAERPSPPININVESPAIHVAAPEIHNHLPELQPSTHVIVEPAAVTVEHTVQAGDVQVVLPEQAAPVVQITNEVTPAPIREIAIVAMPKRETTTEVSRDGSGNIVASVQSEEDA